MTTRRTLSFLLACTLLSVTMVSHAADDKAEPSPKQVRDPFWPVGWQPHDENAPPPPPPGNPERWPKLELNGVSKTPTGYIALLKHGMGMVTQGQVLRMKRGNRIYRWKIVAINKNGINAKRLDAKIVGAGNKPGNKPGKKSGKAPAPGPAKALKTR